MKKDYTQEEPEWQVDHNSENPLKICLREVTKHIDFGALAGANPEEEGESAS